MLSLPPTVRVFVAVEPVDMRGSFDSLAGAVRRLGTHRDVYGLSLDEMTPAAFKASRM